MRNDWKCGAAHFLPPLLLARCPRYLWLAVNKPDLRPTTFGRLPRSELMSRVRGRGNLTTELRLMSLLRHARLSGWRRHCAVKGRPDFCWIRERVAVFVHGCFWHAHNCGRNLTPKSNYRQWQLKFRENKRRDAQAARSLRKAGWAVVTIWECNLKRRPQFCIDTISRLVVVKACGSYFKGATMSSEGVTEKALVLTFSHNVVEHFRAEVVSKQANKCHCRGCVECVGCGCNSR